MSSQKTTKTKPLGRAGSASSNAKNPEPDFNIHYVNHMFGRRKVELAVESWESAARLLRIAKTILEMHGEEARDEAGRQVLNLEVPGLNDLLTVLLSRAKAAAQQVVGDQSHIR